MKRRVVFKTTQPKKYNEIDDDTQKNKKKYAKYSVQI